MMARDVPKNINGNDEAVLKITTVRENPKSLRVHLCGQFTGEYVSELEKTMSGENIDAEKLALDLSNVTFVDREAMMFLMWSEIQKHLHRKYPILCHALD
jgi:hypothetical protein